jgi:hypothetical protein
MFKTRLSLVALDLFMFSICSLYAVLSGGAGGRSLTATSTMLTYTDAQGTEVAGCGLDAENVHHITLMLIQLSKLSSLRYGVWTGPMFLLCRLCGVGPVLMIATSYTITNLQYHGPRSTLFAWRTFGDCPDVVYREFYPKVSVAWSNCNCEFYQCSSVTPKYMSFCYMLGYINLCTFSRDEIETSGRVLCFVVYALCCGVRVDDCYCLNNHKH